VGSQIGGTGVGMEKKGRDKEQGTRNKEQGKDNA